MERIPSSQFAEAIGHTLGMIEPSILKLIKCDFLCGCNPIWVGFANYTPDIGDGRSYLNTAHVAYPCHQRLSRDSRKTTVVLPIPVHPIVIVHELGHVLDEALGFEHIAEPITKYARLDRGEAFAEAFLAQYYLYGDRPIDEATQALFESLKVDE